jgi:O-acetyl-ADP-ribose deacetylase (regulator of RNase III)
MKKVKGDLIKLAKEGAFDLIIHGCNCFGTMGAGIARTIKSQFPVAYTADLDTKKGILKIIWNNTTVY